MFHVEQAEPWSVDRFQQEFAVSRETMQQLHRYAGLLVQWQQRMNLVGPTTLSDIWGRHFADSAQLLHHAPAKGKWLDIGAGGGFPGLLLALLGAGPMVLVDSVAKKVRFLETLRAELGLESSVLVQHDRIEQLAAQKADVVTARAVAALDQLFDWSLPHASPGAVLLFPKGRRWEEEVDLARRRFSFDLVAIPSMTDADARILRVQQLKRR